MAERRSPDLQKRRKGWVGRDWEGRAKAEAASGKDAPSLQRQLWDKQPGLCSANASGANWASNKQYQLIMLGYEKVLLAKKACKSSPNGGLREC